MVRVIMHGCNGAMGRVITGLAAEDQELEIVAGIDVNPGPDQGYPVFPSLNDCDVQADVVVDFASAKAVDGLLDYCEAHGMPLVLCTTGLSEEQILRVGAAAEKTAILRSANMSLGINVLLELVKKAASVLGDSYDIEIVERHHRRKVDAPSGTALMIADAAAGACGHETEYVFERHSVRHPRDKKEIGISAVRGGTIVGEHEIIFAGHDEVMEIRHTALSREIFAQGAVEAAKFMAGVKAPGLYDMSSLIR